MKIHPPPPPLSHRHYTVNVIPFTWEITQQMRHRLNCPPPHHQKRKKKKKKRGEKRRQRPASKHFNARAPSPHPPTQVGPQPPRTEARRRGSIHYRRSGQRHPQTHQLQRMFATYGLDRDAYRHTTSANVRYRRSGQTSTDTPTSANLSH